MIKIAICDDNKEELSKTRRECMAFGAKYPTKDIRISTFEDASSVLSYVKLQGSFDIMILDIYMPNITGVELAASLREENDECEIIFLTSSATHAIEAFTLNATHYILKPYTTEQFDSALSKAFSQIAKRKKETITLKSTLGTHKILFANFLYSETQGHMQNIHLTEGITLKVRMTSIQLYERLSHDSRFYKCGSTYILNLGKVKEVSVSSILLDTNEQLHMQRRQYKTLLERYTRYAVKGE